ncbi:MAG: hypothetical protein LW817_03880, partial [Candidatus Caenarcaniphilales bacterium]|nr:hypothetical protein [Candidatus Caenarcaniphilales bacterium]
AYSQIYSEIELIKHHLKENTSLKRILINDLSNQNIIAMIKKHIANTTKLASGERIAHYYISEHGVEIFNTINFALANPNKLVKFALDHAGFVPDILILLGNTKIDLEIDGNAHNHTLFQKERDEYLKSKGVIVVRVDTTDCIKDTEIQAKVNKALSRFKG